MTISQFVTVEWAPASDPTDLAPTWVDITAVVQSVDVQGGRSGVFDLYGPRTATIVCLNGTKSPVVAPTFILQPFYKWRQIRVLRTGGNPIFTGYISALTHDQTNAPFSGSVTIDCVDLMGIISRAEFQPSDVDSLIQTVNGLKHTTDLPSAVDTVLGFCGLTQTATVNGGSTALFKLDDQPSGNILQWLQNVIEAEVGGVQVAADGTVYVLGRWEPFAVALAAAGVTFSDTATGAEYQYLRENLTFASTDTDYYNRAVTKSTFWEPTFTASNITSGYPSETISRTDEPFVYQSWAEANAALYAQLYSQPRTYPRSLVVYAASAHAAGPALTELVTITTAFGATHVVVKQTQVGDTQVTYNLTVENAHHSITPELWTCELGFGSLDRWIDAYGDGATIYELVAIGGDSAHGIGSAAIIAP